jgi:hypothetical protein
VTERLFQSKIWFCGRVPCALLLGVGLGGWALDASEMPIPMMQLMLWTWPAVIPIALLWLGFDIGWRTLSVGQDLRRRVFTLSLLIGLAWVTPGAAMYIWAIRRAMEIASTQ